MDVYYCLNWILREHKISEKDQFTDGLSVYVLSKGILYFSPKIGSVNGYIC